MHPDSEDYMVYFHERARPLFFSQYNAFRHTTGLLDRQLDENRFQQLKGVFTSHLQQQLQQVAMDVLSGRVQGRTPSPHLEMGLTQAVNQYLREFRQKIDLL